MTAPGRSAAIAKALAMQTHELPANFPAEVAALAQARASARHVGLNDLALLGAFVLMIGICIAGWFIFEPQESGAAEWLDPVVRAMNSQPWLAVGVAGVAIVQMLTFRRRTNT